MQLRKFETTLVFNSKAKTMVKMVEIFSLCFSVLAVFQQAGLQYFADSSDYNSLMKLNVCEHLGHEIYDIFGIQHKANKDHLQGVKILAISCCRIWTRQERSKFAESNSRLHISELSCTNLLILKRLFPIQVSMRFEIVQKNGFYYKMIESEKKIQIGHIQNFRRTEPW